MKKKVNMFGKSIPVFVIAIFAMVLDSAALVSYISNTVTGTTDVSSPITVVITSISAGSVTGGGTGYTIALFGGETYTVDTDTIVHTEVTGHIAESVIFDFDGVGIDVNVDFPEIGDFDIVGCQDGGNTYYYIGNPSDVLPVGTIQSTTTVTTALNLEPRTYESNTTVILVEGVKCGPFFSP